MKNFPIIGTNYTIPYGMIEPHEKQAIKNHGQDLERLASRGGLDWIELFCVLLNTSYDKNVDETKAKNWINEELNLYNKSNTDSRLTISKSNNLRPCIVKSPADKPGVNMKAYFHRWCDKSKLIAASSLCGGDNGGIIKYVTALVEYEDGTMGEWTPDHIQFTDRK